MYKKFALKPLKLYIQNIFIMVYLKHRFKIKKSFIVTQLFYVLNNIDREYYKTEL